MEEAGEVVLGLDLAELLGVPGFLAGQDPVSLEIGRDADVAGRAACAGRGPPGRTGSILGRGHAVGAVTLMISAGCAKPLGTRTGSSIWRSAAS
jgi:hypothetical protein